MPKTATPRTDVVTREETDIESPRRYKAILMNDDYTTMDFVVAVLQVVFHKEFAQAYRIMMKVHREGMGVAGVYVKDVAEAKCVMVHEMAEAQGFPLRCVMEPE